MVKRFDRSGDSLEREHDDRDSFEVNARQGSIALRSKNMRVTDVVMVGLLVCVFGILATLYLHHDNEKRIMEVLDRGVVAQLYTACVIGIPPEFRWQNYRDGGGDRCIHILDTHSSAYFPTRKK